MIDNKKMGKLIKSKLIEFDIPTKQLAKEMYIDIGKVYNWQQGKCLPRLDDMQYLAEMFGTTVDEMIKEAQE